MPSCWKGLDTFKERYARGPEARANSNEWKDAVAANKEAGLETLKPATYDETLEIGEAVHGVYKLGRLLIGEDAMVEHSAYALDDETGLMLRARPDLVRPELGIMFDLKTCISADERTVQRSIVNYRYHVQAVHYLATWNRASDQQIDRFVFLFVEKSKPYVTALYELDQPAIDEAAAQWGQALDLWASCCERGVYPGYPATDRIQPITIPPWAFYETDRDEIADAD